MTDAGEDVDRDEILPQVKAGLIKFYGLFWSKKYINWDHRLLGGVPIGWTGRGRGTDDTAQNTMMNFWGQQGIYVLYDASFYPLYAGRAGGGTNSIGNRLNTHHFGSLRNTWEYFSWFGLLGHDKLSLRTASKEQRLNPKWSPFASAHVDFGAVISTLEAILIEGAAPRFNGRGGDLKGAVRVRQIEQ